MFRYIIKKNGKYGFIDQNGQEVIKAVFERVSEFNEGLAWAVIERNDNWFSGFINENGDWVIEPVFSGYGWSMNETSYFSDGLAPIQTANKKMMYINKSGIAVTDPIYDKAFPFSENRALVSLNEKYGYIDEFGNQVITCQYGVNSAFENNSRFSEGLAAVRFNKEELGLETDDNFGFIDLNGETYFEPEDYYANAFSEGFAMVKNGFDYYFINKNGECPFDITTQTPTSFSEGFADMFDDESGCFGFINTKGEWAIAPKYKSSLRFTEGLAFVKRNGAKNWGVINTKGDIIISESFDLALPFKNGLAYVQKNKQAGYINKLGEFIWGGK